ncbi:hypothetical protein GIV66_30315 [Pseudomonas sp. PA-3-11C]|uniref:hypothetical protein n=1 Tax=unclassified Pseudomonas TaxID=196821 RepID=UPI001F3B288E|nr:MULTISPECIES: hypothetical protein [unclassified Pseudomonas]MCF5512073.1 hypothetical protein [Pseudomonas sp. PA-3-6H]MCF5561493.1 hypothetical protein [Pseudomonas sp. PA-3-5D]MCF5571070.1 hypothetical protein [Pseudomonas sp. PA-3-11C]MCF5595398.1 hypothetical protein [Pseudomonas sp. PA-3-10C]
MEQPKKVKTSKSVRQPTCPACNKRFRTTKKSQKYCNDICSTQAQRSREKARHTKREQRVTDSDFMNFLSRQCKNANTLQILEGHTLETMLSLYQDVWRYSQRAGRDAYHICHIAPVSGGDKVGKLHPDNLVIGQASRNQSWGNKFTGAGLWITSEELKIEHHVYDYETPKAIAERIKKFVGVELFTELAVKTKIQTSQRIALLHWFEANDQYTDKLLRESTKALEARKAAFLKEDVVSINGKRFRPDMTPMDALDVYVNQLVRFEADPAAVDLLGQIVFKTEMARWSGKTEEILSPALQNEIERICFEYLHGAISNLHLALYPVFLKYIPKAA